MASDPDEITSEAGTLTRRRVLRAYLAGRKAEGVEECPYDPADGRVERILAAAWLRGLRHGLLGRPRADA